jgi:hypothetical protein
MGISWAWLLGGGVGRAFVAASQRQRGRVSTGSWSGLGDGIARKFASWLSPAST